MRGGSRWPRCCACSTTTRSTGTRRLRPRRHPADHLLPGRPDDPDPACRRLHPRAAAGQRVRRAGPAPLPRRRRPHLRRHLRQGRPGLGLRAGARRRRHRDLPAVLARVPDRPSGSPRRRTSSSPSPPASARTTSTCRPRSSAGITVAEITYSNSISVAEHVVMMILSLVRNYIPSYQWVVRGGWNIADCVERSYDLEGMTVGTVAAGRIGSAVLRRLKPFDVELHYTDRHRLPADVERELGAHIPRDAGGDGAALRRGDDQRPALPRDRGPVQRRADRDDEARRLHRQHRPREDLRPGRHRPGAGKRTAGRLRRRRVVPPAGAARITRGGPCRTTA